MVLIARSIGEKVLKKLSIEQKAGLLDLFAKDRKYNGILVFSLIIIFLVILLFRLMDELWALILYFVAMTSLMIVKAYRTHAKLTAHHYPKEYTKSVVLATALAAVEILLFFVLIFYDLFLHGYS